MKKINKRNLLALKARWWLLTKAYKTPQKIVVIESDDWGSIRTSNRAAYNKLCALGFDMKRSPYTLDALETNEDLNVLFEALNSVKDAHGNPACFTANMIMANPDFEAIKENEFSRYIFEPVSETLEKDHHRNRVRSLWKEGLHKKLFYPQLHAREHIRYWDWMKDLQNGEQETIETFKLNMCGVPLAVSKLNKSYFQPPYIDDTILSNNGVSAKTLVTEGAELFRNEFGFKSKTTIAPNCGWTKTTEKIWADCGVNYIQGGYLQEHHKNNKVVYIPHYLGEETSNGLVYLVRNCTFEPSKSKDHNYWKSSFKQVEQAFLNKTPAIISSHRVNYIGAIEKENRTNGINQLQKLLTAIVKAHPDVLFLNSSQLGGQLDK